MQIRSIEEQYHQLWREHLELSNQTMQIFSRYAKKRGIGDNELILYYDLYTEEESSPGRIAETWCLAKQTLNSILRQQEKLGRLRLATHPRDARSKIILLTEEGKIYGDQLIRPLIDAEIRAMRQLPIEEVKKLLLGIRLYNSSLEQEISQL